MENNHTGLVPTCKEVHRLTSEALDRELTLMERARRRFHLLMCGPCQAFTDQMRLLRRAMRRLGSDQSGPDDKPK